MTILDDLFNTSGKGAIVNAVVTTNQTGGLRATEGATAAPSNTGKVHKMNLTCTKPGSINTAGLILNGVAQFGVTNGSPQLVILQVTAGPPGTYKISWEDGPGGPFNAFVPSVDPVTNIVYGPTGSKGVGKSMSPPVFLTISLCDLDWVPV